MDALLTCLVIGIGYTILQTVLTKIQNPKKHYASLDDRALFHTHSFNKRYTILSFVLGLALPLLYGFVFSRLTAIPDNAKNGLIGLIILGILIMGSTFIHFWHLSGISKAEIDYRNFKQKT